MCGRQYRVYRCGHRILMPGIVYCHNAKISPRTGRQTMCGLERTVTDVADSNLCGDIECYYQDLVNRGWICHICRNSNYGLRHCEGTVLGRRGQSPCEHQVCRNCRYA